VSHLITILKCHIFLYPFFLVFEERGGDGEGIGNDAGYSVARVLFHNALLLMVVSFVLLIWAAREGVNVIVLTGHPVHLWWIPRLV
jgi:hypothetical protein